MRLNEFTEQNVTEAGTLDRYRDRIGTSGQSDRYRDSQERDHDRRQDHYDAEHQSRLNRVSNSDRVDAARTQHEIDVLAHRLGRMQKDDDDWEKTFDMMRDRLNRYQWSSQRDVNPEQLAAISNIKYEPRKKTEAVQGNLMAVTPEYWQKAVLARYPNAQFRHQKMMNGAIIAVDNNKEVGIYDPKTSYAKVGPTTEQGVAEAGQWSKMDAYQRDYAHSVAGMSGQRRREDDEHHEIDRRREEQLAQYATSGKFWLKFKDSGKHVSDQHYIGKAAATTAAHEMMRNNPEVKGNLLLTAYGPNGE